ncbi:MAG: energy transducer TonB [Citromicrobium sp.]|nr:energy transducer TonB [Citromicrobium sp.]
MQAKSSLGLDAVALIVAGILHVALVAALLLQGATREPMPVPERITVNFAEEVGMTSAAPDPVQESQASVAPELGEQVAPPIEYTQPQPLPQPTSAPAPSTRATSRPAPRPTQRATSPPRPRPQPSAEPTRSGGSRVGSDFLAGSGSSETSSDNRIPASQIGASARASIVAAIARQVKPHWQGRAPSGADAEQLVSIIAFDLNPDGSLRGRPRLVSQQGITPANSAQKERHAEVAIRAVQLAAPFDLPPEYYNAWKTISGARFDRNLSQ